jgi:hypothetical protein
LNSIQFALITCVDDFPIYTSDGAGLVIGLGPNSIRFRQRYVGANNIHYDLIHNLANVDKTTLFTFSNGYVGMGTTTPYAKLHITQGSTTVIDCIPLKICTGSYAGSTIGVPNGTSTLLG